MPSSSKCCSICLDDMALTPKLQQISCTNQHSIHIGCFTKMGVISGKTNCPLCRDVMRCITCGHVMKRVICLPCYVDQLDHPRHHHENEPNDWMPAHCVWAVVSLMLMSHLDRVAFPISYRLNGLMSVINSLLAADSWILRIIQEMQARRPRVAGYEMRMRMVELMHGIARGLSLMITLILLWASVRFMP